MPTCAPSSSRFRVTETVCLLEDWTKIRGKRGSQNLWQDETGRQIYSRTEPGRRELVDAGGRPQVTRPSAAGLTPGRKPPATETPEFRRWFGDSKVVDGSGKPLVVYHGTRDAIDAFDPSIGKTIGGFGGEGVFFVSTPEVANNYAYGKSLAVKRAEVEAQNAQEALDVFVGDVAARVGVPAPESDNGRLRMFNELLGEGRISPAEYDQWSRLDDARYDAENREVSDEAAEGAPNIVPVYLSLKNPKIVDCNGLPSITVIPHHMATVDRTVYDGIIFRNVRDNGMVPGRDGEEAEMHADVYVAFRPEQIKSATGNRGTFDPQSPRITESRSVREVVALEGWVPYEGNRGGRGWRNDATDEVRYVRTKPRERGDGSPKGPVSLRSETSSDSETSGISQQVRRSLGGYKNAGHASINRLLRHPEDPLAAKPGTPEYDRAQAIIHDLDAAVASSRLDEPKVFYRGVGYDLDADTPGIPADIKPGDTFTDNGFASTSTDQRVAKKWLDGADNALLVIRAPAGTPALAMDQFTENQEREYEWLLPRGMTYRVLGVSTIQTEHGLRRRVDAVAVPDGVEPESSVRKPGGAEGPDGYWIDPEMPAGDYRRTDISDPRKYPPAVRDAYEYFSAAMRAVPPPTVVDGPGETRYQFGTIFVDSKHQDPKRLGNEFTHEFAHYFGHETGFHLSDEFRAAMKASQERAKGLTVDDLSRKGNTVSAHLGYENAKHFLEALSADRWGLEADDYFQRPGSREQEVFATAFQNYVWYGPRFWKHFPEMEQLFKDRLAMESRAWSRQVTLFDACGWDGAALLESDSDWDPNEHPREDDGRFADKGEGGIGGGTVDKGGGEREARYRDMRRSRKTPVVEFPKPIVGPSGAKLLSYEWKYTLYEDVDARGEERIRRVSDWDEAVGSDDTGRSIVHQFHLSSPDGKPQVVSLESALKELGYLKRDAKSIGVTNIKTLASALKRRALAQVTVDQRESLQERFDAAMKETRQRVDGLSLPDITEEAGDEGLRKFRMGDAQQWKHGGQDLTPDDRKSLEREWRRNRLVEMFPLDLAQEAAGLDGRAGTEESARSMIRYNQDLSSFRQETDKMKKKIGDLDRQIQILADEAAETAAGGVSGPEKHRAALRQLDEIWTTLQMGADGRKYADPVVAAKTHLKANGTENWNDRGRENGSYEMQEIVDDLKYLTGRAYDGRKTGKALYADEIPKRQVYSSWEDAIPASPDKKVTKWYMENKEAIEDVLQRLEKWKRQYRPERAAESRVREGWITLNAGSGDDEEGGVRVYIEDGSGKVTAGPEGLMGKAFPEARGKSRPVAQLREPGETKAGGQTGDTQAGPAKPEAPEESPPAEIARSPGMPVLRFPKPIVGPSGARLESYEWKYTTQEDEEAGKRRVSDWAQAVGSDRTGRDIVHQFHVIDRDGNRKVVSLDSALKELGYVPADAKTAPVKGIKDLGTALKRRGLAQLEIDRREDLQRRFDATLEKINREVAALPIPAAEKIEDQDGYSRHRIGDVEQRQAQTGGLNDDVRKELEQEWRKRRAAERFPLDLGREAAEAVGLPGNDTEARAMASRGLRYFKDDTAKKRQQLRRLDQKIEELAGQASRMAESALCRQVTIFEAWSQHEGPRGGTYWLKDGDRETKTYRRPSDRDDSRLATTKADQPTSYPVETRGRQYVVRPEAQQRDPHGRLSGDFTQRELAAHVIDRELGGRLIPVTEFLTTEGGQAIRQPQVAGQSPASLTDLPAGTQQALAAFDFIIGAANRRPDQVKLDPDGRPQLVGNGRAFYSNGDLAQIGFGDAAQRPAELGGEGLAVAEMVLSYEQQLRPQLLMLLPDPQVSDLFTRAKMLIRHQRNLRELFSADGFASALEVQEVGFPTVSPTLLGDDPETWGETPADREIPEAMHDRAFVGADRYEEYAIRFNQALRRELGQEPARDDRLGAERDMTPHWPAKIRQDVTQRIPDPDGALDRKADRLLGTLGERAEGLGGKTALEKVTGAVISAINEPAQANRDLAQAIQYAAAERFGGRVPAWADRTLYDQDPELFHAIAQGIYDNTQNRLRAARIPGLVVYRGLDLTPQPEEFRRLWDTAATGRGAVRAVDDVQVNQQPVASWTQNPYLAHNAAVGYGSNRQMLIGAWVPAEKIFSLPFSGPGDASSQEVLTLGEYKPERTRAILFNDWRYSLEDKHMMGPLSAVGSHSHEWFWGENPALTENPQDTTAPHGQRKGEEGGFMYAAGDEPEPGLKVLRPHSVEQDGDQRVESYLAMDQRGGSEARTILLQVRAKPYRAAEAWVQHEGPRDGTYWIKDGDQSTKTYRRPNGEGNRRDESDDRRDTALRGADTTGGGNGRLRAGAAGLGDVGLPGEVQPAGSAGERDGDLRGLDGATMKLAGVKLQDRDRESLAQQGLYLHGTSADFTHFRPGGHGAIYLSSADSHGRVTQAEHIASGPFGGRLVAVKVDQSKLKKFDPLNDPESKRVWQTVFGDKPVRDYVDYPDMHLVVKAASPFGYNAFRVFEPAVQGMSLAVTDPTALQIVGDSRLPRKEPDQATTEVDDKAGLAWKSEIKTLLPGIDTPIFHATTGPRASQIYQQGVRAGQYSDFGQGNVGSVSLTENLDWALEGHRGNYVLVFDRKDLTQQGELIPFQAPGVPNEFEQRFLKDAISPSSIKGVIVNGHLATFMQKEAETWGFPVVYRDNRRGWTRIGGKPDETGCVGGLETSPVAEQAISESGQSRRPVVREILLDRDPGIAGWLHRYRVFQASEGWVEYKGPRGGTYYVKDGNLATKTYRKPQDMGAPEAKPATPGADAAKPATGGGAPPDRAAARPSKTDTPEFKSWFGGSKVVDGEGRPLVIYHATASPEEFNEFQGITYFADKPEHAAQYVEQGVKGYKENARIIPVYVRMERPYVIAGRSDGKYDIRLIGDKQRQELEAAGYDGVVGTMSDGSTVYAAFRPEAIKSAVANSGTFDRRSRKITESVPLETHPLLHEGWIEYDGPLGGEGWKNTETGKVRYVEEMPGGGRSEGGMAEPETTWPQDARPPLDGLLADHDRRGLANPERKAEAQAAGYDWKDYKRARYSPDRSPPPTLPRPVSPDSPEPSLDAKSARDLGAEMADRHGFLPRRERAEILRQRGLDPSRYTQDFLAGFNERLSEKEAIREAEERERLAPYYKQAEEIWGEDLEDESPETREAALWERARELYDEEEEERETERRKTDDGNASYLQYLANNAAVAHVGDKLSEALRGLGLTVELTHQSHSGASSYYRVKDSREDSETEGESIELRISDHEQPVGGGFNQGTGEQYGDADVSIVLGIPDVSDRHDRLEKDATGEVKVVSVEGWFDPQAEVEFDDTALRREVAERFGLELPAGTQEKYLVGDEQPRVATDSPEAPKSTPIRFKVRGSGEWEWDGEAPVVKGPLGGMPHYRVTRLEDGRQGTLTSYGREGWRIDLDGDSSYRPVARGGGRNPIEAKQKAERQTETRSREGDREAGESGRKAALQMMDTALSDMRPLRQQAEAMSNDIAPRRAETTRIARENWGKVVNCFGPKALEAIGQVKKIAVYEDQAELAKSLVRWDNPEEKVRGIQGAYRHDDKTGELLLSGAGVVDPEGTYAHELTHAVDGPQSVYSSARKWRNAWKAEIGDREENKIRRVKLPSGEVKELVGKAADEVQVGDKVLLGDGVAKAVLSTRLYTKGRIGKVFEVMLEGEDSPRQWRPDAAYVMADSPEAPPAPLTRYAQTSASEGFAEFGRLLVADPARAKREFPKCWKCWREWHLVEEPTAGESATTGRLREYVALECLAPNVQLNKE